ncbi:hypothetical protein PFISCL1PPCAC_15018, partial [Pristionchus fissidentatus]
GRQSLLSNRMEKATESSSQTQVRRLLKDNHIDLQGYIGKGAYSKVQVGFNVKLGSKVAVKVIDTSSGSEYVRRFLPREIEVVRSLNHSNVVKVFQVLSVENKVLLVEEYGDNGDLLKRIKDKTRLSEKESKPIFRQLIESLSYLQSQSIVHRDVKCENVFLDANDNVKLGDFGFARFLRQNEISSTFCGSRAYVAPEILSGVSYTGFTVDTWSAGIVLYVMTTGVMPYDDRNPKKMLERMLTHRVRFPRMELSTELKSLIFEILHPTLSSRPSYSAICVSQWLLNTKYEMRNTRPS